MNKFLSRAGLLFFGLAVGFLIAEGVSALYLPTSAPLTDNEQPPVDQGPRSAGEEFFTVMAPKTRLHPYLGYTLDPSLNSDANRFGFLGPDTTLPKSENVIRIGITGGSVSQFLYSYRDELKMRLEALPAFNARRIEIISFGLQGYKQPQQLFALTYLLIMGAKIDAVINLDGINEAALPWAENVKQGAPIEYPRSWDIFTRKAVSVQEAVHWGRMADLQGLRRRLWRYRTAFPWRHSKCLHLAANILDQKLHGKLISLQLAWENTKGVGPAVNSAIVGVSPGDGHYIIRDSVEMWKQSSLQMARLCAKNGIRYFHFLGPNQYMEGSRNLTEAEKRPHFDNPSLESWLADIEVGVKRGYPLMVREGLWLKAEGVNFFDLTNIFRDVPQTVYGDYCCHYNDLGNKILMKNIVKSIGQTWEAGSVARKD